MVGVKLNRAIMQLRYLNPEMFKLVNNLLTNEIGKHNLFKFRFTLTYIVRYLEEYLTLCEQRYQAMSNQGGLSLPAGSDGKYST
jgi:hypothetical protein